MDKVVARTISLFEYLQELSKAKASNITDFQDYDWSVALAEFSELGENVYCVKQENYLEDESAADSDLLLKLYCPDFEGCPMPENRVKVWLKQGWDNFKNNDVVNETITIKINEENEKVIKLAETKDNEYCQKWLELRGAWQARQNVIEKVRLVYASLYQIHLQLDRDKDQYELVAGNGFFCDKENEEVRHPLLLHALKTEFDAEQKIIYIKNDDTDSDFYNELFAEIKDINRTAIKNAIDTLKENDIHPFEKNQVANYLSVFMHTLSTEGKFYYEEPETYVNERFYCYLQPVFFIRNRPNGAVKTINSIIEDLEEKEIVPEHIGQLVNGGQIDINQENHQQDIDEILAETGGEDIDILLSKEANKEQLEIAKKIAKHTGVLVQGPPGTGKTHTIANLLGHFLAQGKSVLVTSHTTKALAVLKDKVVPELQPLCVAVIGDTNKELEQSISGITDYIGRHNSNELASDMSKLRRQRQDVIKSLADIRKKIFAIMMDENKAISVDGKDLSLSEMAKFVNENSESLSYIPGPVELYKALPLTMDELRSLYKSNGQVSSHVEKELLNDFPAENELIIPTEIKKIWDDIDRAEDLIKTIENKRSWKFNNSQGENELELVTLDYKTIIPDINVVNNSDCRQLLNAVEKLEKWQLQIVVDGKEGSNARLKWERLCSIIEDCCNFAENLSLRKLGNIIDYGGLDISQYIEAVEKLADKLAAGGSVSWLTRFFDSKLKDVSEIIKINGKKLSNTDQCKLILDDYKLQDKRITLKNYWDSILVPLGIESITTMNQVEPEKAAKLYVGEINRLLDLYQSELVPIIDSVNKCGICLNDIVRSSNVDSELVKLQKTVAVLSSEILDIVDVCNAICCLNELNVKCDTCQEVYTQGDRSNSVQCRQAAYYLNEREYDSYVKIYQQLKTTANKFETLTERNKLLEKLGKYAPGWRDTIIKREGIHGNDSIPEDIVDAWTWRQYNGIVSEYTKSSFDELQNECARLSNDYRVLTAQYAAKSAWWNLLHLTEGDLDLKQALQGWMLNVKKIGKGTGKLANKYRRDAKKNMAKCQKAVPAWIMPVNRALELLDPKVNKFDIVIIDEASQSDVTALAVLYMGKKVIVVGDDKQVSPMAIGVDKVKMMSMISDRLEGIPNANLYTADTSLYGIAMTTYQPLMLKEHFRCVPEIIGFSNMLSYDYKIKPLRDVSKCNLLPYIVSYRVANGKRSDVRNINIEEAKTIVALIAACIDTPEYADKSMGVITLLGSEQAEYILQLLINKIGVTEMDKHGIICGNASHLQGDERDVIFLSMVDSGNEEGPLRTMGEGIEEANKKRYNVAMSRAKDQVWIVHSLDKDNDLKSGDMRKTLLDYAVNPKAFIERGEKVELMSESPFEAEVAKTLVSRGYHIEQQVAVGSYRIDMVAYYGEKKIAIECDGDKYHSGADKIIEDMERQTILERLGWRFIRIRGSEYYRAPEKTMARVEAQLEAKGILQETINVRAAEQNCELLTNIKSKAGKILDEWQEVDVPKEPTKKWGGFRRKAKSPKKQK